MGTRAPTNLRRTAALVTVVGAGIAFAGGSTAWASTAPVTTATCGTPAHAALYRTVQHEAVPAVTHQVKVIDQAYVPGVPAVEEVSHLELIIVDGDGTPAGENWTPTGRSWTIQDSAAWTEFEWQRTVIDQAASPGTPAVPPVTHEETVVVHDAWDEKVVDSHEWTESVTGKWWNWSPNKDQGPFDGPPSFPSDDRGTWQGPHENGGPGPEDEGTYNISHSDSGNASWFHRGPKIEIVHPEVSHFVHHDAVTRTETVVDVEGIPAVPATEEISHVETAWTRDQDTPPEGSGWALTGEEVHRSATSHTQYEWARTVVDTAYVPAVPEVPEQSHMVVVVDVEAIPAWTEKVLVVKAVPAGPPCAASPASVTPTAVSTESLAQTGLDLALPLGAGFALVFAGGVLVAVRRIGAV